MARAIWSGSLSFGLVNVPVGLFSATEDHDVHFHQFARGTSARVRNKRVNERTGDEVDYDDIVKGAEISDDKYVIITPEELESVEPGKSRTIDISDFVDATEIDPIYFQKSYYLAPSDDTAKKAYSLLVHAMEKADRIGIATFVMRGKQYLAAVRPADKVLVLSTMHFADEVRDPRKVLDNLPARTAPRGKDMSMAVNLIEAMTSRWDPKNYRDTYTDRVKKLVSAKKNDRVVVNEAESDARSGEKVTDLLAALQASVDESKGHKAGNTHNVTKLRTRKADEGDDKKPTKKGAKKSAGKTARKPAAKKTGSRGASKKTAKKTSKKTTKKAS